MSMFTSEAKLRHVSSKWDHDTRQVFSIEEFEINEFLAEDDEYNKTDEPTVERTARSDKMLRDNALEKRAEALAAEGNVTKEKMLAIIRHREKQRATARKIKFLRGKLIRNSTTMVTVQSEQGISKDLTEKADIEVAIMKNNQAEYQQSFHTPFLISPLREEFEFKGLTTAAQAVLGGVYVPKENDDPYTKDVLQELQMPQTVRDLGPQTMKISMESYRNFWKKAKEMTSAYPDALSFATMKVGATDDQISEFECSLINIALKSGYSPERWRHLLDVMILKNPTSPSSPRFVPFVYFRWTVIMPSSI
jgi:hypothetical protein